MGDLIQDEENTFLEIAPIVSINCHLVSATEFRDLRYKPNASILSDFLSKAKRTIKKSNQNGVTQFRCKGQKGLKRTDCFYLSTKEINNKGADW